MTASEIASWAWCPESWRLGQGLGLDPGNRDQLREGERIHSENASVEERSRVALAFGLVLVATGVLALGLFLYNLVGR